MQIFYDKLPKDEFGHVSYVDVMSYLLALPKEQRTS